VGLTGDVTPDSDAKLMIRRAFRSKVAGIYIILSNYAYKFKKNRTFAPKFLL
jgi:hypothetical protein